MRQQHAAKRIENNSAMSLYIHVPDAILFFSKESFL